MRIVKPYGQKLKEAGPLIHILHYISGFAKTKGGVETYIINLYDHIDKEKFKFSALTRNAHKGSALYKMFLEKGIKVYDLEIPHLGWKTIPLYVKRIHSFFKEYDGEFSFIHMHGFDDPFVISTAKQYGLKQAAVHVHQVTRESADGMLEIIKNLSSNTNIHAADYLFACSEDAGKAMYGNKRFQILKNALDTKQFTFDAAERARQREKLNLADSDIAIGYVGRLMPVKNIGFLLDVFACLYKFNNHVRLFIAGEGEERQKLEKQTKELGIENMVSFLGERNDIDRLLQGMDLYLQTSLHEGFSFSALEAQCCGLPTIISDGFPTGVEVTDLVCKIPLRESKEAWANRIAEMLDSCADQLSRRGEYAAAIESSGYDSRRTAATMAMLYSGELAE